MASLANAMRGVVLRGCAQQLRRQTPTAVAAISLRSSAPAVAQQTRSMSVFQNLKDSVTQKIEERNQGKQGNCACRCNSCTAFNVMGISTDGL